MRRVKFSAAVSLDGYIAGPNGEYDWIVMDPDIDFGVLMSQFDTVFMGRKSYEMAQQQHGGGMPGVQTFVFSRTLRPEDCKGAILRTDPQETLDQLRLAPGKDIWLFGGGILLRSMLEQGLVDAVELAIMPVLLGSGIALFPPPAELAKLKLVSHQVYPKTGTVLLEYIPAAGS